MKQKLQSIETAQAQGGQPSSASSKPPNLGHEETGQPAAGEPSFSLAVQPFSTDKQQTKPPSLPKFKPLNISEHRHAANPALAMNLLQEIEEIVARWQTELQTVMRQIQDIYLEGPIVDGWLESHGREANVTQGAVRPAAVDRLLDYVEQAWQPDAQVTLETPRTGYRLCGLDASGQFWARPCPAEQVATVSLAIARHQKLRQLLRRKEELETRLSQLAQTLIVMHSHLSKD